MSTCTWALLLQLGSIFYRVYNCITKLPNALHQRKVCVGADSADFVQHLLWPCQINTVNGAILCTKKKCWISSKANKCQHCKTRKRSGDWCKVKTAYFIWRDKHHLPPYFSSASFKALLKWKLVLLLKNFLASPVHFLLLMGSVISHSR